MLVTGKHAKHGSAGFAACKAKNRKEIAKIYVVQQLEYKAKKRKYTNREKLNTHHRENKQKLQCYH